MKASAVPGSRPSTPIQGSPALYQPLPEIDRYLAGFVRSLSLPASLRNAVEYALLGGGKRVRPLIAWQASVAAGGRGQDALPVCAAVELIHAFSLVHDDLPALDNDDLRRGKPTLHRHAGEASAILAGDAMMAMAFSALVSLTPHRELSAMLTRELAAGTMAMIEGQVYDTLGGLDPALAPIEQVRATHARKTGALILASARMGAMCGSAAAAPPARDATLEAISVYGRAVGLMFQVADDLLDVEQTAEHTGKRTGKDRDAGKLTYPGVLGVEGSRAELARLRDEALASIVVLGPAATGLRDLCLALADRTK